MRGDLPDFDRYMDSKFPGWDTVHGRVNYGILDMERLFVYASAKAIENERARSQSGDGEQRAISPMS